MRLSHILLPSTAMEAHLKTRPQNVVDNPKQYIDSDRPNKPVRITGFRPTRSEVRLQCSTVIAWVRKNNDCYVLCHYFQDKTSPDKNLPINQHNIRLLSRFHLLRRCCELTTRTETVKIGLHAAKQEYLWGKGIDDLRRQRFGEL